MRHPTEPDDVPDARLVAALDSPVDVDVDAAWRRLAATRPAVRRSRFRNVVRRPAFGFVAVALVLTGAGTAAANDWLQIFQTETITPVSLSADDLVGLPDLSAYGEVKLGG